MGGHVAIASLELHPEVYQGGLIECGVVDGVELVDWLYAYTAAAEYFSGLPLLETPRPELDKLANVEFPRLMGAHQAIIQSAGNASTMSSSTWWVAICPCASKACPSATSRILIRATPDLIKRRSSQAMPIRGKFITKSILVSASMKRTLNRDIPRVEPGLDAEPNPVFAELTGKIRVPVMTLHETADFRAPFRLEQDYRTRTDKAGTSHLLVQRAVRATGHCGFSSAEREPALGDLIAWIEQNNVPEGDHVLGDVTKLGLRWTRTWDFRDPATPK